ncbi:MAG: hypothetical protein ACJAT1_000915 [Marivirga sp.]|jgi:hypothetical protein
MKKKKLIILSGITLLVIMFIVMLTYSVDLMPDSLQGDKNAVENEAKGKEIMRKAWVAHGIDSLYAHEVYELTAVDDWKGPMAGMGKLWPQKNTKLQLKYVPNTFDAQLTFLDGETKGMKAGLQAWQYYEKQVNGEIDFDVQNNTKYRFGMAAFQYFIELCGRLNKAEYIRYAGEKEFNGKQYDLVFATWGALKGHPAHDQYLLYINQENNMLEYVSFTVRDNYLDMPGSGIFYGSAAYSDIRNVDGFQVPFTISLFMNGPSIDNNDYLHQLKLSTFSFDGFDQSELYPNQGLKPIGDSK